jgi:hypothetical protein
MIFLAGGAGGAAGAAGGSGADGDNGGHALSSVASTIVVLPFECFDRLWARRNVCGCLCPSVVRPASSVPRAGLENRLAVIVTGVIGGVGEVCGGLVRLAVRPAA